VAVSDFRNGYPPYPETLVISAERSGLNLVRHACEVLSGRRTPGKVHIVRDGPLLFHRTHYAGHMGPPFGPFAPLYAADGSCGYSQVLLLLRDPAESFVRAFDSNLLRMKQYCRNIQLFDSFPGRKLVVPYDDLVGNDDSLAAIFDFLGIADTFDRSKLDWIRKDGVAWYNRNQPSGSQTGGDPGLLRAHQSALTPEQRHALGLFLAAELGGLAPAYLSRWNFG
jgi:hypothetical protein